MTPSARVRTSLVKTCAAVLLIAALGACGSPGQPSSATQAPSTTSAPTTSAIAAGSTTATSTASASTTAISTAAATTPPLGAPLPADLIGTWTSNITAADAAVIAKHDPNFGAAGAWTLVLSATTFQFLNPQQLSPGPYPVGLSPRNQITVAPELDCPSQKTQDGGQYAYHTDGNSLTLTPIRHDSCPFREWLLIAHPWHKQA